MQKKQKRSLFSLYLSYYADYFSWGAITAFLSIYLAPNQSPFTQLFWNEGVSFGIALVAFPVGEVIGSPILGDLSDWIGRKKVLIWGLWGSIFSTLFSAISIWFGSFLLFVLCQLLIGFFSGKQAMAQAAIVDIQAGGKGQKLAFLSVLGGLAWVSGPYLGKMTMGEPYIYYGGYIWPSLLALAVYVLSLIYTQFYFNDIYHPPPRQLTPSQFFHSIGDLCVLTWRESVFFIFLLNLLGWYLLAVSLSDFLIVHFHLTETQIGFFNNYLSLCFTLGGVVGTVWILHRWRARNVLFWTLLAGAFGLFLLFGAETVAEIWTYLAIPALTEAWIYPAYQTVLSDQTSNRIQGKLFGLIGASNGACQFLASVIMTGVSSKTSIFLASVLFLCSAAMLPLLMRKRKQIIHT